MADSQDANLQFAMVFGKSTMLSVIGLIASSLLYGIYILLFYASFTILCRREGNVTARCMLLTAIVLMFLMTSFEYWTDVVVILEGIKSVFVDKVGTSFKDRQAIFAKKFITVVSIQISTAPLEVFIGDLIVFWRVWALCYGQRRFILVLPFIFLVGTAASSLGVLGCFARNNWPVVNPPVCSDLILSTYILSAATNLSGTLIVGLKVWFYRKHVKVYLSNNKKSSAEKILVLILESGAIYSLLWIVQIVIVRSPPPPTLPGKVVRQIFKATTVQLVGIYPTLLVVLIYMQRSLWDAAGSSPAISLLSSMEGSYDHGKEAGSTGSQNTLYESNRQLRD